ncbi:MAG: galactose mutarotase [Oscillospiraceae bacterium]|nr:galactose mutarotase [Oscillospiraceae bacterium]
MPNIEHFGNMPNGDAVYRVAIENSKGMQVRIITYGGIMQSILLKDDKGEVVDVILGKETLDVYLNDGSSSAAVIGRVANRIGNAVFELNGKTYPLFANDRGNCLHGGKGMYGPRNFILAGLTENSVKLALFDNGEGGFPGEVNLTVTYTVTEDNAVDIFYTAVSTEDTPINLTNHVYFNLEGQGSGPIYDQEIMIDADFYTPCDDTVLPTGEIASVAGTPIDLREFKTFGTAIKDLEESGCILGGFDHNIVLNGTGYRKVSVARDPKSKRYMETYTDLPGVQLFTANSLGDRPGKDGAVYTKHGGFCLETQFFPDTINKAHFPGGILKKGEVFTTRTTYAFGVES